MTEVLEPGALNTQPIPPGISSVLTVSRIAIERAWLLYDIQMLLGKVRDGDDWLPVKFLSNLSHDFSYAVLQRFIHPPHPNWQQDIRAVDLLLVGAEMRRAAEATDISTMRNAFRDAAARLEQRAGSFA